MPATDLRAALERVQHVLTERPDKARSRNTPATARLAGGLRCEITGPDGESTATDMPRAVGGAAASPSPGWLLRGALASCNATCIAMRAARQGIELSALEVTVTSESDMRPMLGMDDSIPAGLQDLKVNVRIAAPGRPAAELEALARSACLNSPVGGSDLTTARIEVQVDA